MFVCFHPFSLRPRASSSSSQSERSASPLVMNSTQSLDIMPRFAVAEEEGARRNTGAPALSHCRVWNPSSPTVPPSQWTEWSPTCNASGCGATAQAPGHPSEEEHRDASLTNSKPQRNPDPQLEKFQSLPRSLACLSSSPLVDVSSLLTLQPITHSEKSY